MTARPGSCRYVFNPSELYQRTKPGQGVETVCGAPTWPIADEPEIAARPVRQPGSAEVTFTYIRTGRMLPREVPDPYCPAHGGSAEPPPPPVQMWELEQLYQQYRDLAARFQAETGMLPADVRAPEQIEAAPPAPEPAAAGEGSGPAAMPAGSGDGTAAELEQIRQQYEQLATQAQEAGVSNGS